eukprot:GILK01001348.1.p1 GENE.GILK01001348.1~~GILK01001348.1.p1  ORF type:complete len:484 (-),score=51.75 GILK01001348.1:221-1612(-)
MDADRQYVSRFPSDGKTFPYPRWPIHRLDKDASLKITDFDLEDDGSLKYYDVVPAQLPKGVSCFIPLEQPHLTVMSVSSTTSCHFILKDAKLSDGLSLYATHQYRMRFRNDEEQPQAQTQMGWHCLIFPIQTFANVDEFAAAVLACPWNVCSIRARGSAKDKFFKEDEDLNNVDDFRVCEIYRMMESAYETLTNANIRVNINDICAWIAHAKPRFEDLSHPTNAYRAWFIFTTLLQMYPTSTTELTYLYDLFDHFEESLGLQQKKYRRMYNLPPPPCLGQSTVVNELPPLKDVQVVGTCKRLTGYHFADAPPSVSMKTCGLVANNIPHEGWNVVIPHRSVIVVIDIDAESDFKDLPLLTLECDGHTYYPDKVGFVQDVLEEEEKSEFVLELVDINSRENPVTESVPLPDSKLLKQIEEHLSESRQCEYLVTDRKTKQSRSCRNRTRRLHKGRALCWQHQGVAL